MSRTELSSFDGKGTAWNELIAKLPAAHLLQTWEWSQVKAASGWEPMPLVWRRAAEAGAKGPSAGGNADVVAAAMVLRRRVLGRAPFPRRCILYVPKGPLLDPADDSLRTEVLADLEALGEKESAIFVKLDPNVETGTGFPGADDYSESPSGVAWGATLAERGWRFSDAQIQFRNTACIELRPAEEELLARMKQKTRYNIRLAERKGVTVRSGDAGDIPLLYEMYVETARRDGFVIRDEAYYRRAWSAFLRPLRGPDSPAAQALIAEDAGRAMAGLMLFAFAGRAYYLYGMSTAAGREKMPNYLLQWEAMKLARIWNCSVYDLWGAPESPDESDRMWGVFRFKQGLGGQVVRTIGAWDHASSPFWYGAYTQVAPRLLDVMRRRGRQRLEQLAGP